MDSKLFENKMEYMEKEMEHLQKERRQSEI